MTEASAIIIPDASTLTVDTSCIDVSEVESQEDKDFLMEKGGNILRIVARAALEVGYEVYLVQERFRDQKTGNLTKFYASLDIDTQQARNWANKFRLFVDYVNHKGGGQEIVKTFNGLRDQTASLIHNLPEQERLEFLMRIGAGELITREQVQEVSNKPETKLSKATELLFGASSALAEAEKKLADKSVTGEDRIEAHKEKYSASRAVNNYEQQIADLEAQIEEERLKTAQEAEEKARLETELQKLKFDDAKVKAERVKKLSTTLTVSLPQTLADVSKFFAEIDQYPEDVREHIYDTAKNLANTIADKL